MNAEHVCRMDACEEPVPAGWGVYCSYHKESRRRNGDSPGNFTLFRFWPTDDRRPHESVPEWCARLDSYYNAPSGSS